MTTTNDGESIGDDQDRADVEFVDDDRGLIYRRVVVGALSTNCWIIATTDSRRAIVIDPGDEAQRVVDAAADLTVNAVVLTHAHWDHVLGLPATADAWGCDVHVHPHETPVWPNELVHLREHGYFDAGTATEHLLACGCPPTPAAGVELWTGAATPLRDGQRIMLDGREIEVLHTPGHTPGGVSLLSGNHLFGGDTLFPGGPGLTGWPLSDFDQIIDSIRTRLFSLADSVQVHPGHGRSTTIGAERPQLAEWIARRW